jgi:MFS family permease
MIRRLAPLMLSIFVGGIALWIPVEKLFMSEIGFTPATVGVMAAAYAVVVPLLEIPSGVLADRWSRRGVLVVGNVGALLSVLVGALSTNVATYVVAALLLGVYFAMQSGTLDSIVYDTVLEETGSSARFDAVLGRVQVLSSAALVLGAVAGGLLGAATSPRATYVATLPFLGISTVVLLRFREPRLHRSSGAETLRQHVATTICTLRSQPQAAPIVGLLVLTALLSQAVFEFGPLWLVEAEAGTAVYGPAWAGLMSSIGLGGAIAGRVRLDARVPALVGGGLLVGAGGVLLVARDPVVASLAQIVIATVSVAFGVVATRLLHDRLPSAVRSSVSSGVGAGGWVVFLPFALAFGAISERFGVSAAGWLLVAAGAATGGLLLMVTRPHAVTSVAAAPAGNGQDQAGGAATIRLPPCPGIGEEPGPVDAAPVAA